jgi:hypothetical protein
LSVYSNSITDLILRAANEIESISKELYKTNGGDKLGDLKFDEDAIKYLIQTWKLNEKVVLISSYNCFLTISTLKPFEKNDKRTNKERMTFSWNNAYQNLKHARATNIEFGSIKYLFDIMAALYLLNIYYKNESFDLGKNSKATDFQLGLGSEIFSIKLHVNDSITLNGIYPKEPHFNESVYFTTASDETSILAIEALKRINLKRAALTDLGTKQIIIELNKELNYIPMPYGNMGKLAEKQKVKILNAATERWAKSEFSNFQQLKYVAFLNKNQV